MAPAVANNLHRVYGTAGNSRTLNPAFLASLGDEGPLAIAGDHMVAKMLPNMPRLAVGNARQFDLRRAFFTVVANMEIADDLRASHIAWFPLASELTATFEALDRVGMPTDRLDDEVALRARIAEYMPSLAPAERTLTLAKVHVLTPPANWVGQVNTGFLVGASSLPGRRRIHANRDEATGAV